MTAKGPRSFIHLSLTRRGDSCHALCRHLVASSYRYIMSYHHFAAIPGIFRGAPRAISYDGSAILCRKIVLTLWVVAGAYWLVAPGARLALRMLLLSVASSRHA